MPDAATSPADLVDRIVDWLAGNAPGAHALLRPGASDADLDDLEREVDAPLPEAFRALYRRCDGQERGVGAFGLPLEPLAGLRAARRTLIDVCRDLPELSVDLPLTSVPPGAVALRYADPGWLPFLSDGGGNHVAVDLAPGPTGTVGQVITFGRDDLDRVVLAESLGAFLAELLDRFVSGRVSVHLLEGFEEDVRFVDLLDADGRPSDGAYLSVAALFPGFGASPARRSG